MYDSEKALTPRGRLPGFLQSLNATLSSLPARLGLFDRFDHRKDSPEEGKLQKGSRWTEMDQVYAEVIQSQIKSYILTHNVSMTEAFSIPLMKKLNKLCTKNMVYLHAKQHGDSKIAALLERYMKEEVLMRSCIEALDSAEDEHPAEYRRFVDEALGADQTQPS